MEPWRNHGPAGCSRHSHPQPPTNQPQLHPPHPPPPHSIRSPHPHPNAGSAPCSLAYHGPLHLLVDLVELQRVGHGGCGRGRGRSQGGSAAPPARHARGSGTGVTHGSCRRTAGEPGCQDAPGLPKRPQNQISPPQAAPARAPDAASGGGTSLTDGGDPRPTSPLPQLCRDRRAAPSCRPRPPLCHCTSRMPPPLPFPSLMRPLRTPNHPPHPQIPSEPELPRAPRASPQPRACPPAPSLLLSQARSSIPARSAVTPGSPTRDPDTPHPR